MTGESAPQKIGADGVEFRRDGEDLVFSWPRYKLTAWLHRARERSDGVAGELLLSHELAGNIFWGHVSLGSVSARERIATKLKREIPASEGTPNWTRLVDGFCFRAAKEFRGDGTFVRVGTMDDAASEAEECLVSPLLLKDELNMIFASSGTGKGYLAAALALQADGQVPVLPLPVPKVQAPALYLDFEWGPEELNRRLRAICRGIQAPDHVLLYRRMAGALADQANTLRAEILREGIKFLVVDSAQIACGDNDSGDPAAAFNRLVLAIRTFGVTTLLIDHPAKGVERGNETPYGTRYKLALCRNIWKARKSHGSQEELHVGLWHDENSNTPHHPPLGFRLVFDRESWPTGRLRSVRFFREDVRDVMDFSDMLTDWQKIERELLQGPKTTKELAEVIDRGEGSVRTTLSRRKGQVARLPDGKWAAIDRTRPEQ